MLDFSFLTQPLATLLGAVLGLGTIAWQTNRGFANLIKAQDHRAKIENEARVHSNDLALKLRIEGDGKDARKVAAAIQGEIESIIQRFDGLSHNFRELSAKQALKQPEGYLSPPENFRVKQAPNPIFNALVSQIGLLSPSLVKDVCFFYAKCDHHFDYEGIIDSEYYCEILDSIAQFYSQLVAEGAAIANRLDAFHQSKPDPGPATTAYSLSQVFVRDN